MHFPRILITLLALIAHAHCGTLRDYSRDWLIPKPEPQVGAKRITAKSVFITPNLQQNVRCAQGYQEDSSGRCVKIVHVNQEAQLDFLLQRLNAMYGAPVVSHSEKQPLQVSVEIPVQPTGLRVDNILLPQKGEGMLVPPVPIIGETPGVHLISDDDQSNENQTKEESALSGDDKTHFNDSGVSQVTNSTTNEESQNDTSTSSRPDDFLDYWEGDPYVSLTIIEPGDEESVRNDTVNGVNSTISNNSKTKLPDRPINVVDDDLVEYKVTNNTTKIIKKETPSRSNLTQSGTLNPDLELHSNQTSIGTLYEKTNDSVHIDESGKDHLVSNSTSSTDKIDGDNSVSGIPFGIEFPLNISDESTNEIKSNLSEVFDVTSPSVQDSSNDKTVTTLPTTLETTTVVNCIVTLSNTEEDTELGFGVNGSRCENLKVVPGDEINVDSGVDLEVDYDRSAISNRNQSASAQVPVVISGGHQTDVVRGESADGSIEGSATSSESDVGSGGSTLIQVNEEQYSDHGADVASGDRGDLELGSVPDVNNRTDQDEVYSVSKTPIHNVNPDTNLPFKIDLGYINESSADFEASGENTEVSADLELENTTLQTLLTNDQNNSEQSTNQPNSNAHPSVHVVYPQPVFQTIVKQKPQTESSIEPITDSKIKDSIDFKPSPLQIHNLNPQDHVSSYFDPIVEKAQDNSQKYGGFPYPPLPPLPETRPPRPSQQPPINQNQNGHSGFVRFPVDTVRTSPQSYGHRKKIEEEVNTVRFPQDDGRYNDKYSRWGGQPNTNWRFDQGRNQQREQGFWQGRQPSQYPQGTNRRDYWADNWPNRRRQSYGYYH